MLKTGSGQNVPAHGSEPLGSPTPVGKSAGIWRVVAGKMYARARTSSLWPIRMEKMESDLSEVFVSVVFVETGCV